MVKITACVITKNEEVNIKRWIASMKRITQDLVVVDTGSTDHTRTIAEQNGAKVYDFLWQSDFAAAKNFAIDQARGEWIIFLDADEYFSAESSRNVIRYIESYQQKKIADALVCKIINIDADDHGRYISEFYNLRIFKNDPAIRYIRPVHEMLSRRDGSLQIYVIPDGVEVYHTGYSSGIIEGKLKRNLEIVLAEIEEKGEQRQHYRYLCECYHGLKQFDLAEKYARLHIEKGERSLGRDNSIHKRLIECMMLTRQQEQKIMDELDKFQTAFPDDPEFLWYKGELLFSYKDYGEAERVLQHFLQLSENKQAEQDFGQTTLHSKLCASYYPLGFIAEYKGEKEKALFYYQKSLKNYKYNHVTLPKLLRLLVHHSKEEILQILKALYADTVTDVKFIVKSLGQAVDSPVYLYYQERLRQFGEDNEQIDTVNAHFAASRYDLAAHHLSAELLAYYDVLLLTVVLDPSLAEEGMMQAVLPQKWRNVWYKIQGDDRILSADETAILEKLLQEIPDEQRKAIAKRLSFSAEQTESAGNGDSLYRTAAKLYGEKKFAEAEVLLLEALENQTKYDAEAYRLLGFIYYTREEYVKIADAFEKALACTKGLQNDFTAGISQGLARMYLLLGKVDQAKSYYLQASAWCSSQKEKQENYSSYLLCYHYSAADGAQMILRAHQKYQSLVANQRYDHQGKRNARTRMRIGYLSADFREHVLYHFYHVLLSAYDRTTFSVTCYSIGAEDGFTERLKKLPDVWRSLQGKTDEEIAAVIHEDQIDILVDLGGHSANSGLPVLAYQPAPIQISGLGYINTTGLDAVDYFITDIHLAPSGFGDEFFTEKLLRLPYSHFCYQAQEALPPSTEAPCRQKGYITFGCFNQYPKITDEMLKLWKDILDEVEHSVLLLKCQTFLCDDAKALTQNRLAALGFDIERVRLEPPTRDYMKRYLDVDIALDTSPYQGGGTTCDALYMGVPVVTLIGDCHRARFGYSILKNIGLEELAAESESAYRERAVALAHDRALLDLLHRQLRVMMEKSPLMNAALYMNALEAQYKKLRGKI